MDMTKTTLPRISKDSSGGLVYKCTGVKCHGSKHPSRLFFSCMHKSDSNLHLQCLIRTLDKHYVEQQTRLEKQQKLEKANQASMSYRTSDTEETESQTSSRQHAGKDIPKDGKVGGARDSNSTSLDAGQTSDHDARKQASTQNTDGKDIPKDADCMESKTAEEARIPFMHGFLQLDNTSKDNKNIIVLTLLAALVWFEVGGLQGFEAGFMEVGHTHLDCDQLFAELTKILGKEAVDRLRDLLEAGEKAGARGE
eukprot:g69186.t1